MAKVISYITGSRAYGKPKPESDVDLIVACETEAFKLLWEMSESETKVAFGKLNLILFNLDDKKDRIRFRKWREVHEDLVEKAPVSREEAIEAFNAAGVTGCDSGD